VLWAAKALHPPARDMVMLTAEQARTLAAMITAWCVSPRRTAKGRVSESLITPDPIPESPTPRPRSAYEGSELTRVAGVEQRVLDGVLYLRRRQPVAQETHLQQDDIGQGFSTAA